MQKRWLATSPGVVFDYLEEATQIDPFPAGAAAIERVVEIVSMPAHAIPRRDSRVAVLLVAIAAVIGVSIGIVVGTGARLAASPPVVAAPREIVATTPLEGFARPDEVSLARPRAAEPPAVSMQLREAKVAKRRVQPVKRAPAKRRPVRVDASTALGNLRVR